MARDSWEPLVELPHGDAVASVMRDHEEGWLWLCGDSRRGCGTGISDYGPFMQGWPDRWVVGGALPPGATRAQVLVPSGDWIEAEAANGAWVCVVESRASHSEHVVLYRDTDGQIVPRPLPADTQLEPVSDASEPCPSCGGVAWDVACGELQMLRPAAYDWPDPSEDYADRRTVICRGCGHQEHVGMFAVAVLDDEDEEPWPSEENLSAEEEAEIQRELAEAERLLGHPFQDAAFPLYGLDSAWRGSRSLGGSGASDGRLDSVALHHGSRDETTWVSITTEAPDEDDRDEPPERRAEEAYTGVIEGCDTPWPRVSEEALTVWLQARQRELREAVADTRRQTVQLSVDGDPTEFTLIGSDQRWAAAASHGQLRLTIEAVGIAPREVRLVRIDDGSSYQRHSM